MKARKFFHSVVFAVLLLAVTFSSSGCFYLVFGGAAAAGGYAISRDTIQGELDREFSQVWDTAIEIVSIMGRIESQNSETGQMIAIIQGSRVTINLTQITPATIRIKVKARKAGFPRIGLAQEIYLKVTNQVDK